MERKIKGVVFDLDHTLFDRYATLRKIALTLPFDDMPFCENISREELGEIMVKVDKEKVLFGWDEVYDEYKKLGLLKSEIKKEKFFDNFFRKFYFSVAVPFPFTKPMLKKLQNDGYKVGLLTNGDRALQTKKLQMLELTDSFDAIVISGDTPYNKPDPRIFSYITEKLSLKAEECIYVGDNPLNDVDASSRAGLIPVWVKTAGIWQFPELKRAEYEVETVEEIPSFLEKINNI
ncbi:MAG: HAD family hydrolase [Clostridiales bacterium]|nr:HAD family hydrolase [Candidatus Equinaster intestinalis]